ncbi:MAG TPA: 50S ribosomal protein L5 [Candidatus Lokiarchaeia archaeon]|nr:50S ribosomal protein L5 [Candidatus Lokiarchaeia archaeon]
MATDEELEAEGIAQTRVKGGDVREILADWESNPMRKPRLAKVIINIAVGQSGEILKKASTVIESISGQKPTLAEAKRSVKEFNIRKKENIATFVTLRGKRAEDFLKRVLVLTDNRLRYKCFDNMGNFSLGVTEHIQIPGTKYDPEVGIFGLNVNVRLERPGIRVRRRRKFRGQVGFNQYVTKAEAELFMEKFFGVELVEKIEARYY